MLISAGLGVSSGGPIRHLRDALPMLQLGFEPVGQPGVLLVGF